MTREQAEFQRVEEQMCLPRNIFVFGSNEAGIHGAGAAKDAIMLYGAKMGVGRGPQGHSYAIPTKDRNIETLPLEKVAEYVQEFLDVARTRDDLTFVVTKIGCGLAGFTEEQIAPLFKGAPEHCLLPIGWREMNGEASDAPSWWQSGEAA